MESLSTMVYQLLKYASATVMILIVVYVTLLCLLTKCSFQAHFVYLHKIQMTWFKDLSVPETFGFLRGQVTPFAINSLTGEKLFAWHILPIGLYRQHEAALIVEPSGVAGDITSSLAFKLLRDDPDARLIIHMHGAGGTVGSGYRVPNYRALSAGHPSSLHVLTFDYRGFGRSLGTPSERGICDDAIAVVDWVIETAGIRPPRILIFGQSLGAAVVLAVSNHFALQSPPIVFAGTILVAPFVDIPTLVATYRVAGLLPILSPLAKFPWLFNYLSTFIVDKWMSKDRIAGYIRANEANKHNYQVTLIHAKDDFDVPWHHTEMLFWHAFNAISSSPFTYEELELLKCNLRKALGAAGTVMEWQTKNGTIREEILRTGLHDVIMGDPIISMAVMRIFGAMDPSFE